MGQKSKSRAVSSVASTGKSSGYKGVADAFNVSQRTARRWLRNIARGNVSAKTEENIRAAYATKEVPVARSRPYTPDNRQRAITRASAPPTEVTKQARDIGKQSRVERALERQGVRIVDGRKLSSVGVGHHILRAPGGTLKSCQQKLAKSGISGFADIVKLPNGRYQIIVWDERTDGKKKGESTKGKRRGKGSRGRRSQSDYKPQRLPLI